MKKPIIAVPMVYGTGASGLLMLLFVTMFYLGKHPINISPLLDVRFLILPLFMFIGMKDFRDRKNEGVLHFWQALVVGLLIFVITGMLMALFIMIFNAIDGDFLQSYINERLELFNTYKEQFVENVGKEAFDDQIQKLPLTTAYNLAVDYFVRTIIIGLFLNIIISIILRKQPNKN